MNKPKANYSYIGITTIILIFGAWSVPKIVDYFKEPHLAVIGKAPEFTFINQNGKTISNSNYKDKVYLVEFFFTTCPSICPIMNQRMVEIQGEFLGNPQFGIASFTINPDTDTPEVLLKYAQKHKVSNPNWHFLTGNKKELLDLSIKGFNLYASSEMTENGDFSHSGLFALIDKKGNIRSRYDKHGNPFVYYQSLDEDGFPNQIPQLKQDIQLLLNE